jgi:hypothetical protein
VTDEEVIVKADDELLYSETLTLSRLIDRPANF